MTLLLRWCPQILLNRCTSIQSYSMEERLQKILSRWGLASRREAESWLQAGRVRVNGAIAHLGQRADPTVDVITVDGIRLTTAEQPKTTTVLLNKPLGYVSTCADPQGRATVLDLLPLELRQGQGIHPVGRLDVDSSGALLLTNNGDLTFHLTHPRHHIAKIYQVWVSGRPSPATLQQWRRGVVLDSVRTHPAQIEVLRYDSAATLLRVILTEGRNRQIRRVAEQLGYPVERLHRLGIGPITLGNLPRGGYRILTAQELSSLNVSCDTSISTGKSHNCLEKVHSCSV